VCERGESGLDLVACNRELDAAGIEEAIGGDEQRVGRLVCERGEI
jgi:hypothetical protein